MLVRSLSACSGPELHGWEDGVADEGLRSCTSGRADAFSWLPELHLEEQSGGSWPSSFSPAGLASPTLSPLSAD